MDLILIGIGLGVGALVGWIITSLLYRKDLQLCRKELESEKAVGEARKEDRKDFANLFAGLSSDALQKNNEQFLTLAEQRLSTQTKTGELKLEEKKKLIDGQLAAMDKDLKRLSDATIKLTSGIENSDKQTARLQETTQNLSKILSNTQKRGQWGEKMVEDILQLVGMVKDVNYVKQKQVEEGRDRPDFTFFLPKKKKVNLDAKFPLEQYENFIAADDKTAKETAKIAFLRAVKNHIKDVASRKYINPADNTVDYVLLFIPNESIYAFIHESDSEIIDLALKDRIILCSPLTLYAILSLIHQAISNFAVEERTGKIKRYLQEFHDEWMKFQVVMDKMERALGNFQNAFTEHKGARVRKLDKVFDKIQSMQQIESDEDDLALGESSDE